MRINTRKIRRIILLFVLIVSTIISITITYIAYRHSEWGTMTSSLTVITAILAIWSSLNLTWSQEDEKRPQLSLHIDNTSHKFAYSLVIKNSGGSPAYNVKLEWTNPILDYNGKAPRFTDSEEFFDFDYLPTDIPYSRFLFGANNFKELLKNGNQPLIYEGIVSFSPFPKSKLRETQNFKISLEPYRKHINVLNDQMDFYFENKKISEHLKSIAESLKELNTTIGHK
jgi:hypothetical protein